MSTDDKLAAALLRLDEIRQLDEAIEQGDWVKIVRGRKHRDVEGIATAFSTKYGPTRVGIQASGEVGLVWTDVKNVDVVKRPEGAIPVDRPKGDKVKQGDYVKVTFGIKAGARGQVQWVRKDRADPPGWRLGLKVPGVRHGLLFVWQNEVEVEEPDRVPNVDKKKSEKQSAKVAALDKEVGFDLGKMSDREIIKRAIKLLGLPKNLKLSIQAAKAALIKANELEIDPRLAASTVVSREEFKVGDRVEVTVGLFKGEVGAVKSVSTVGSGPLGARFNMYAVVFDGKRVRQTLYSNELKKADPLPVDSFIEIEVDPRPDPGTWVQIVKKVGPGASWHGWPVFVVSHTGSRGSMEVEVGGPGVEAHFRLPLYIDYKDVGPALSNDEAKTIYKAKMKDYRFEVGKPIRVKAPDNRVGVLKSVGPICYVNTPDGRLLAFPITELESIPEVKMSAKEAKMFKTGDRVEVTDGKDKGEKGVVIRIAASIGVVVQLDGAGKRKLGFYEPKDLKDLADELQIGDDVKILRGRYVGKVAKVVNLMRATVFVQIDDYRAVGASDVVNFSMHHDDVAKV